MDKVDAHGVLMEWVSFLADSIARELVEIGGEIKTDVTSSGGYEYRVEVTSRAAGPRQAILRGEITDTKTGESLHENFGIALAAADPDTSE